MPCAAMHRSVVGAGRRYAAKRAERGDPLDVQFLYSGADRARFSLIHFIPDFLKYSVPLFPKR